MKVPIKGPKVTDTKGVVVIEIHNERGWRQFIIKIYNSRSYRVFDDTTIRQYSILKNLKKNLITPATPLLYLFLSSLGREYLQFKVTLSVYCKTIGG